MNKEDFVALAKSARLAFSEEEEDYFYQAFCDVRDLVSGIEDLDLDVQDLDPYPGGGKDSLREGQIQEGLSQEDALANAPTSKYGYIQMLKFVE